jgi:hypothetical protein
MKAKLIKDHQEYILINDERFVIATTDASILEATDKMKLSKQNCDELFGVVDVEKLAIKEATKLAECKWIEKHKQIYLGLVNEDARFIMHGFNKAMELNKDRVFTLEQMREAIKQTRHGMLYNKEYEDEFIQSLQQPTEIEVEILMQCLDPTCDGINRKGICIPGDKPKLDSEGCLILKKM